VTVVTLQLFNLALRLLGKSPRRLPPLPKLLPVVFARQLLEQPVGGALDLVVVFGTGALFGGDKGAAMWFLEVSKGELVATLGLFARLGVVR
jgi:hypothetical protein